MTGRGTETTPKCNGFGFYPATDISMKYGLRCLKTHQFSAYEHQIVRIAKFSVGEYKQLPVNFVHRCDLPTSMSIDEFEIRYRESMREVLDQLQYAVMLSAQLQDTVSTIGSSLQTLNHTTEQFITQQRDATESAPARN